MTSFSKMIDLLDEDKPIAEQKFVCMSFISPENEIKNKSRFFFEEFVKQYDFNKSTIFEKPAIINNRLLNIYIFFLLIYNEF